MGCSALGGAGIASTCGRGVPARSSRTWSRDPCTQPSSVARVRRCWRPPVRSRSPRRTLRPGPNLPRHSPRRPPTWWPRMTRRSPPPAAPAGQPAASTHSVDAWSRVAAGDAGCSPRRLLLGTRRPGPHARPGAVRPPRPVVARTGWSSVVPSLGSVQQDRPEVGRRHAGQSESRLPGDGPSRQPRAPRARRSLHRCR